MRRTRFSPFRFGGIGRREPRLTRDIFPPTTDSRGKKQINAGRQAAKNAVMPRRSLPAHIGWHVQKEDHVGFWFIDDPWHR